MNKKCPYTNCLNNSNTEICAIIQITGHVPKKGGNNKCSYYTSKDKKKDK